MLSSVLGYIQHPTPNFELLREELPWYILYVITNLFHGVSTFKSIMYRTPNLLAKYHMVVLNLSDQVAKRWLMKTVKDVRTWFDVFLGSVWINLIFAEIIFKYVNSDVRTIFNEKIGQKCNLWNPWIVHGVYYSQLTCHRLRAKKKKTQNTNVKLIWIQTGTLS